MKFEFKHNEISIRYHKRLDTILKIKKIASKFFGININEILLYYVDEDDSKIVLITDEDLKNLKLMEPDKEIYNIIVEDCTEALKSTIEYNYNILAKHFCKELEDKYPKDCLKNLLFQRELLEIKKYMEKKNISEYFIKKVINSIKKNFKLIYTEDQLNKNISIESFSNEINNNNFDIQTLSISFLEYYTNSVISSDQYSKTSSSDFSKSNKFNTENNTDSINICDFDLANRKRKFSRSLNNKKIKILGRKSERYILNANDCQMDYKNKRRKSNLTKMTHYNNDEKVELVLEDDLNSKHLKDKVFKKKKKGFFLFNFVKKYVIGKKKKLK